MSTAPGAWHAPDDDLRRYAAGRCAPPLLWSVESHLAACAACRDRLTAVAVASEPALLDDGWAGLDAALDAPVPGPVERLLAWAGAPGHIARLLAATPALRLSWLAAVALTLALTAALASAVAPVVFLAAAPLVPLLGVAVSFGPGLDPTHEVALVAPIGALRLLLLRVVAVVAVNAALCALAGLAVPGPGPAAAGWFLPSLALTVLALVLSNRLGIVPATAVVAAGWAALLAAAAGAPFTAAGQATSAAAAAAAVAVLAWRARAFDPARALPRTARQHTRAPSNETHPDRSAR
ncbi:cupin domain-containing protein [Dactylosporangium darangshiense]|uniref:Integral membrane protein n=1 Tax=Dactylosporangium darangshiense TaxID=579108 RepID=A0ABP8DJ07_9ACTN